LHDPESLYIPTVSKATELLHDRGLCPLQCSKSELEEATCELEKHILNPFSHADIADSGRVYFENKIVYAIRDWSAAVGSGLLRFVAQPQASYQPVTSAISASVAKTAIDSDLPVVYLCCISLPRGEERSLISTLYSLIHQLIRQRDFSGRAMDFRASRIQELDGTISTWDKGISICSDLLLYAPSPLLVIVDGIERLEGDIREVYVDNLINLLGDKIATQDLSRRADKDLKILFTTTGPCASLNKLDGSVLKTIHMQGKHMEWRPGKPRLGRSLIQL
jgi:hypothetical protein